MLDLLVFAGSYAAANEIGIHSFGFDNEVGALEARARYAGIVNPSFLVLHPNGRCLYAVSELSNDRAGRVYAFRFDAKSGALAAINQQLSGGSAPCHLTLDVTGRWLVVSNYNSGSVCVLPITEDGALGEATHLVQHHGVGTHPKRQEGPHAHSAMFAPDGRFVLVADLGIDQILTYAFDSAAGTLDAQSSIRARPGAGPRYLAFHPGTRCLYVVNELDSTVSVYDYDAMNGALHERQSIPTLPAGAPKNYAAEINIAPDGARAYVSNRGHNSISDFDIAADGTLALIAIRPCGGSWPRNFALALDGRFMLIANQHSGDLAVLPILDDKVCLGEAVARASVPGASCVQCIASTRY
jgi:6-phosphogluconolactonase